MLLRAVVAWVVLWPWWRGLFWKRIKRRVSDDGAGPVEIRMTYDARPYANSIVRYSLFDGGKCDGSEKFSLDVVRTVKREWYFPVANMRRK